MCTLFPDEPDQNFQRISIFNYFSTYIDVFNEFNPEYTLEYFQRYLNDYSSYSKKIERKNVRELGKRIEMCWGSCLWPVIDTTLFQYIFQVD